MHLQCIDPQMVSIDHQCTLLIMCMATCCCHAVHLAMHSHAPLQQHWALYSVTQVWRECEKESMEEERVVLPVKECEGIHFLAVQMFDVVCFSHSFDCTLY